MHKIRSKKFGCAVYVRDDLSLVILPSLFSYSMARSGSYYVSKKTTNKNGFVSNVMELIDATLKTRRMVEDKLFNFLDWVEKYSEGRIGGDGLNLANHHNADTSILNSYINDVLIAERGCSTGSVIQHIMALNAYFNYLATMGFTNAKNLMMFADMKETARSNENPRTAVKYLTPELRSILYRNTPSIRDELLLKTAGELGVRSKENLGFLTEDFSVGRSHYPGLKSLFEKVRKNPNQQEFEYFLQGKYSKAKRRKGGESRILFIHRDLLERMQEYYLNERPQNNEKTFFLNAAPGSYGTPIAENRATKVFEKVKRIVLKKQTSGLLPQQGQELDQNHTYHVLRHSFGTDKFYDLADDRGIRFDDVVPTSQVYLAVAALMGHSAADGSAPKTTSQYIRSCQIKTKYMQDL